MSTFGPRLTSLLQDLLRSDAAVPVTDLADRLRVSRRTVFRELGGLDAELAPYGLALGTIAGRGVCLVGDAAGRVRLAADLVEEGSQPDSPDRHARLPCLALLLVEGGDSPTTLAAYAQQLGVSEATLGHDFMKLEARLAVFGLRVIRRQGRGVYTTGGELAARQAVAWAWQELDALGQPAPARLDLPVAFTDQCAWMTPESAAAVALYVAVAVSRIRLGQRAEATTADSAYGPAAVALAALVADSQQVPFDGSEVDALAVFLSACRHHAGPVEATTDYRRQALACRLIETFDPNLAPVLKLDEDLLDGLTAHLESTLVRLQRHIVLTDPLTDQMRVKYPEIMARSARAAALLVKPGETIPEGEVSFLAAHFGAAVHRLDERGGRRRLLHLGVVCLHGIGSSYLLAAQLERYFGTVARIEVSDRAGIAEGYDVLVSTVPLTATTAPVVEVSPILDEAAVQRVRSALASARRAPRDDPETAGHGRLMEVCAALAALCSDIQAILTQFASVPVAADLSLEQLARLVGYRFGGDEASGKIIFQDLMARERVASQVIPELGIVLLHARTAGVATPVFALLSPATGAFRHSGLRSARAGVLMLVPPRGDTALMGSLSSALVKSEAFLDAIVRHRPERVLAHLQDILQNHLTDDFHHRLKG